MGQPGQLIANGTTRQLPTIEPTGGDWRVDRQLNRPWGNGCFLIVTKDETEKWFDGGLIAETSDGLPEDKANAVLMANAKRLYEFALSVATYPQGGKVDPSAVFDFAINAGQLVESIHRQVESEVE